MIASSGKSVKPRFLRPKIARKRLGHLAIEALSRGLGWLSSPPIGGSMAELWIKRPYGWVSLGTISTFDLAVAQAEALRRLLPGRVFKVSKDDSHVCFM